MDYNQIKLLMLAFTAQPPDQRDAFFETCKAQIDHMVTQEVTKNGLTVRDVKIRENMISINNGDWQECYTRQTIEDRRGFELHCPEPYKLNRN